MRRAWLLLPPLACCFFLMWPTVAPAGDADAAKLLRYLETTTGRLPPRAREAAPRIADVSRRLLAVRGYLRSARTLEKKWVWSPEEIGRFKGSPRYAEMMDEVEKVKKVFAELNPGHTLYANTQVRGFDEQLKNWNDTPSIKAAGDALLADSLKELSGASYGETPDAASAARFARFLQYARLTRVPTVATPGLSPHGQLRAFDFVVKKGNQVVAGTLSANIDAEWVRGGWETKLKEAVRRSGAKFTGPLSSPREPWHYAYSP